MQAKLEFDLEAQAQKMKYQWNINIIDSDGWKLRMDNYLLREGSRTKLFKSLNLTFLMKLLYVSVRRELRISKQSLKRDGRS